VIGRGGDSAPFSILSLLDTLMTDLLFCSVLVGLGAIIVGVVAGASLTPFLIFSAIFFLVVMVVVLCRMS